MKTLTTITKRLLIQIVLVLVLSSSTITRQQTTTTTTTNAFSIDYGHSSSSRYYRQRQQQQKQSSSSSLLLTVPTFTKKTRTTVVTKNVMSSLSSSTSTTNDNDNNDEQLAVDLGYTVIEKECYDIVKVDLADDRDYPIYIGTGYTSNETATMLLEHIKGTKILIITNDRIEPLGYLNYYTNLLQQQHDGSTTTTKKQIYTLVLPDGEENKCMDVLNIILDACLQYQLDRKATLIALGGGVIGDMVGFAAAIYVRGIQFIQIPTTVMSMVDSSVGGKTGINHPLGKNMIGSFHQPVLVLIDTSSLSTLPDRELSSGISEIIKYGLIRDSNLFLWLEENIDLLVQRNVNAIRYAITKSCLNKAAVVKADEREANDIRATLNLGHTFGHAIETGCGYGTYLHGEAVSIGIVMAAILSYRLGWIQQNDVIRIVSLLQRANLPVTLSSNTPMTRELFINYMNVDKKVANGQIRLVLLQGPIGNCIVTGNFDYNIMVSVIDDFIASAKNNNTNDVPITTLLLPQQQHEQEQVSS